VTTTYGYDAASQLTSVNGTGYAYDANGNRNMTGYSTGPGNRLLSDGTWNYSYDAVGNTIQKTNIASGEYWTYAWNDANQLTLASDYQANGTLIQSVTFKDDAFGNQVEQDVYTSSTNQTVTTKYAFDASGNIWADLNASNQLVDRHLFVDVNGQTQPFVRIDASGNEAWYLTDHLGSVRLLTDNSAAVLDQIDYDAWGNITTETNAANGDRYKYASGQWNAIIGTTLFDQGSTGRELDNGHWISADPMGLAVGPNPYDYVANNPTNAIDQTGLDATTVGIESTDNKWKFSIKVRVLEDGKNVRLVGVPEVSSSSTTLIESSAITADLQRIVSTGLLGQVPSKWKDLLPQLPAVTRKVEAGRFLLIGNPSRKDVSVNIKKDAQDRVGTRHNGVEVSVPFMVGSAQKDTFTVGPRNLPPEGYKPDKPDPRYNPGFEFIKGTVLGARGTVTIRMFEGGYSQVGIDWNGGATVSEIISERERSRTPGRMQGPLGNDMGMKLPEGIEGTFLSTKGNKKE
jgi:RHS repeat-associated protein